MELISTGVEFFQKGGIVMYFLLLCSLFVFAIGIERILFFTKEDSGRKFAHQFYLYISNNQYKEAVQLTRDTRGFLAHILFSAICKQAKLGKNISAYMEVQSGIALSNLRRRLYYLNVIVTMAPLLGLLGTISGMISSFSVFNLESGQATAITGGVGEALIATAMGLCVAIIALTVHSYFVQRIENIINDMEQCFSLTEDAQEKLVKEGAA